jgi:hypothetical protein
MNLDEFKSHIETQRQQSTLQAMSVLSATITNVNPTKEKDNK